MVHSKHGPLGANSSDPFVKASLESNPALGEPGNGRNQQVRFIFEVPPGALAVNYLTGKPVHVTVTTNHPLQRDVDFDLSFVLR